MAKKRAVTISMKSLGGGDVTCRVVRLKNIAGLRPGSQLEEERVAELIADEEIDVTIVQAR